MPRHISAISTGTKLCVLYMKHTEQSILHFCKVVSAQFPQCCAIYPPSWTVDTPHAACISHDRLFSSTTSDKRPSCFPNLYNQTFSCTESLLKQRQKHYWMTAASIRQACSSHNSNWLSICQIRYKKYQNIRKQIVRWWHYLLMSIFAFLPSHARGR